MVRLNLCVTVQSRQFEKLPISSRKGGLLNNVTTKNTQDSSLEIVAAVHSLSAFKTFHIDYGMVKTVTLQVSFGNTKKAAPAKAAPVVKKAAPKPAPKPASKPAATTVKKVTTVTTTTTVVRKAKK